MGGLFKIPIYGKLFALIDLLQRLMAVKDKVLLSNETMA